MHEEISRLINKMPLPSWPEPQNPCLAEYILTLTGCAGDSCTQGWWRFAMSVFKRRIPIPQHSAGLKTPRKMTFMGRWSNRFVPATQTEHKSRMQAEASTSQGVGAAVTAREYTKTACVLLLFVFTLQLTPNVLFTVLKEETFPFGLNIYSNMPRTIACRGENIANTANATSKYSRCRNHMFPVVRMYQTHRWT